jgi:predicted nucleic acid-binding protein
MTWLDDVRDRGVFVDTSAYYSYVDRNDQRHTDVKALFEELLAAGIRLHTTDIVVAESHALVLGRINRNVAAILLGQIDENPLMTVSRVTEEDDHHFAQYGWIMRPTPE